MSEFYFIIPTFIISPLFTILIEYLLLRKKVIDNKNDFINLVLINLITNITLNVFLIFIYLNFSNFYTHILLTLELFIPIIEYEMFNLTRKIEKKYLLYFFLANMASFLFGKFILQGIIY